MRNKNNFNKRQRGFTLVEVAMVLAIAALLIAGVMLFFNNASQARQTNDALQEVAAVQQTVRSLYSGQPDYTGLDTAIVASSKQLPAKWANTTSSTVSNPFGSSVTIAATSSANQFMLTFNGIPDAACSKMVTMDMGTGMAALQVGSAGSVTARAMTPSEANAACIGGNSPGNTIEWTFY